MGFIMILYYLVLCVGYWAVNNVYFAYWEFGFLVFLYIYLVFFDGFLSEFLTHV